MRSSPSCLSTKGTLENTIRNKALLTVTYAPDVYARQLAQSRIIIFYRFLLNSFRSVNSLFKVLFIFPSQYLYAIGLP
jgi:hypothetical protein